MTSASRILLSTALCTLLTCFIAGNTQCGQPSSRDIVQQYCELDARGARLSTSSYREIRKLMDWEEDRSEPGWDTVYVVSSYVVGSPKTTEEGYIIVPVCYDIVGSIDGGMVFKKDDRRECLDFKTARRGESWRILEYVPIPRISIETAIENAKERLAEAHATGNENEDVVLSGNRLFRQLMEINKKAEPGLGGAER